MSNEERERGPVEVRPRNWLVAVTLLALQEEWRSYGYELMERAAGFGFEAMNSGTMYRTLRHMEENGTVKSAWETSREGPARRMYSITDAGEAYLDFWAEGLKEYRQTMDDFLRTYQGLPDTNGRRKTMHSEGSRGRGGKQVRGKREKGVSRDD